LPHVRLPASAAAQGHLVPAPLSTRGRGVAAYPNIACILAREIDWALIEQQYDEIARYTTAMAERTADPESILRRFTRSNVQHPTYKALKTIFLCRYLGDEALRREIHEGLNVVEPGIGQRVHLLR
jgi:TnpA family transposase